MGRMNPFCMMIICGWLLLGASCSKDDSAGVPQNIEDTSSEVRNPESESPDPHCAAVSDLDRKFSVFSGESLAIVIQSSELESNHCHDVIKKVKVVDVTISDYGGDPLMPPVSISTKTKKTLKEAFTNWQCEEGDCKLNFSPKRKFVEDNAGVNFKLELEYEFYAGSSIRSTIILRFDDLFFELRDKIIESTRNKAIEFSIDCGKEILLHKGDISDIYPSSGKVVGGYLSSEFAKDKCHFTNKFIPSKDVVGDRVAYIEYSLYDHPSTVSRVYFSIKNTQSPAKPLIQNAYIYRGEELFLAPDVSYFDDERDLIKEIKLREVKGGTIMFKEFSEGSRDYRATVLFDNNSSVIDGEWSFVDDKTKDASELVWNRIVLREQRVKDSCSHLVFYKNPDGSSAAMLQEDLHFSVTNPDFRWKGNWGEINLEIYGKPDIHINQDGTCFSSDKLSCKVDLSVDETRKIEISEKPLYIYYTMFGKGHFLPELKRAGSGQCREYSISPHSLYFKEDHPPTAVDIKVQLSSMQMEKFISISSDPLKGYHDLDDDPATEILIDKVEGLEIVRKSTCYPRTNRACDVWVKMDLNLKVGSFKYKIKNQNATQADWATVTVERQ